MHRLLTLLHFLEGVNIPETVNTRVGFSFSISFQSVLHKPTTYLVSSTQISERI